MFRSSNKEMTCDNFMSALLKRNISFFIHFLLMSLCKIFRLCHPASRFSTICMPAYGFVILLGSSAWPSWAPSHFIHIPLRLMVWLLSSQRNANVNTSISFTDPWANATSNTLTGVSTLVYHLESMVSYAPNALPEVSTLICHLEPMVS